MATYASTDAQNENIRILRGKGIGGATADLRKPKKKYRKDTKALADLSKPAKRLGSTAMEASTLEQKSSQQGTKTTKKAQMSNIFADDETNKCSDEIELFHLEGYIEATKQVRAAISRDVLNPSQLSERLGIDIKMLVKDLTMEPEPEIDSPWLEPEIDSPWLEPEIVSPLPTPPPSDFDGSILELPDSHSPPSGWHFDIQLREDLMGDTSS